MRRFLSILVGRSIGFVSRLTGHKGSSLPGLWAAKIDKNILTKLSKEVKKEIIVVCGTNGKTTTNNMIEQILTKESKKVICNKVGANMYYGVVTAFVLGAPLFGSLKADYATLEVDELSTVRVFKEMNPDYFIMTNLFRDQLDRYGEIDLTIGAIEKALGYLKEDATYILNGDDPLAAGFGFEKQVRTIYYGVRETGYKNYDNIKEGRFCNFCGSKLDYKYYHYSQLGGYECTNCSFKHPTLDYEAKNVSLKDGLSFDLDFKGETYPFEIPYKGFYNIYNIVASVAVANEIGIGVEAGEAVLENYQAQVGRMENFYIKKPIFLNLSKNPAGFNQGIETILEEKDSLDIYIVLNDNAQDGKDISFIWDTYFDQLVSAKIEQFFVSGQRAYDMALRLKYGGIPVEKIRVSQDPNVGLEQLLEGSGSKAYILVNYTALFPLQKALREKEKQWSLINK